jgi:hypothetical protein
MNRDFAEMLSALSAAGAEYLLVEISGQRVPLLGKDDLIREHARCGPAAGPGRHRGAPARVTVLFAGGQ